MRIDLRVSIAALFLIMWRYFVVVCLVGWLIPTDETQKRNKSNHFRETFSKDYYSNIALRIDSVITDLFGVAACVRGTESVAIANNLLITIQNHKPKKIKKYTQNIPNIKL